LLFGKRCSGPPAAGVRRRFRPPFRTPSRSFGATTEASGTRSSMSPNPSELMDTCVALGVPMYLCAMLAMFCYAMQAQVPTCKQPKDSQTKQCKSEHGSSIEKCRVGVNDAKHSVLTKYPNVVKSSGPVLHHRLHSVQTRQMSFEARIMSTRKSSCPSTSEEFQRFVGLCETSL